MWKILFLSLIFMSGCTFKQGDYFSYHDIYSPEKATVYVYRIKQFIGSGEMQPVYVDGVEYGNSLSPGSYTIINLDPGLRVIHSKSGAIDRRTEINFDAGKTYFVRFHY